MIIQLCFERIQHVYLSEHKDLYTKKVYNEIFVLLEILMDCRKVAQRLIKYVPNVPVYWVNVCNAIKEIPFFV